MAGKRKEEEERNTKLSYSRDSAGRRSLDCSKSFKVTDFSTNRKPVCDFLLVNNTISYRLLDIAQYLSNYRRWRRVLLSNEIVFRNLCKNRHNSLLKLDSLDYISSADCRQYIFNILRNWPKSCQFGKITQDNGRYAVQDHSRPPMLVQIESPYATLY